MAADSPLVKFDSVAWREGGRTLSLELWPGEAYAVVGRAGSGKSWMLESIQGQTRPVLGKISVEGGVAAPVELAPKRKVTPMDLAKSGRGRIDSARLVRVISAVGLWEERDEAIQRLSPSQAVAACLLPALLSSARVVVMDGHLDVLDPVALAETLDLMREEGKAGRGFFIATQRPDLVESFGQLVALRAGESVFAGSVRELIGRSRPSTVHVTTDQASTVRTMVEPLSVSVKVGPGRLEITAHNAQALAARLLTQGYGDVDSIVIQEPTVADALIELL
jgi:ABC-type multidrug transport system ATPase subunit